MTRKKPEIEPLLDKEEFDRKLQNLRYLEKRIAEKQAS